MELHAGLFGILFSRSIKEMFFHEVSYEYFH